MSMLPFGMKTLDIFVTAGTQEPFDRLIEAVDNIAHNFPYRFTVQSLRGKYVGVNISTLEYIDNERFCKCLTQADLIIAHAGMGTIIRTLEIGKPIIIFPRIGSQGEHRNNHQLDTIKILPDSTLIKVAYNEEELAAYITYFQKCDISASPIKADFSGLSRLVSEFIEL